jgi:chromatin segregation and condensation protein Rec8/ScpA/Scc1 (kleisin family)
MDPTTKRAAKIEQFKANKALMAQLAAMEEKRARATKQPDQVRRLTRWEYDSSANKTCTARNRSLATLQKLTRSLVRRFCLLQVRCTLQRLLLLSVDWSGGG